MLTPAPPTAQTSLDALPHTPMRPRQSPPARLTQAVPSQCKIVPYSPTAQTSLDAPPHKPQRSSDVPLEKISQAPPFQRAAVSRIPTAHTSPGPPAQTETSAFAAPFAIAFGGPITEGVPLLPCHCMFLPWSAMSSPTPAP